MAGLVATPTRPRVRRERRNEARNHSGKRTVERCQDHRCRGNYACGPGRAGAIFAQLDYGLSSIAAESFEAVFSSVAYKAGLLEINLDRE